jgi:hypothetical protein
MNQNEQQPAFPCVPMQDNFQRLIAPIPGMTKLEYFTLMIYSQNIKELLPDSAITFAKEILLKLDESAKKSDDNTLQIIK